ADAVCAALLHDVLEDTEYSYSDLEHRFGSVVADLVEGVTKLESEQFTDKNAASKASFQKFMQAMSDDFRVVIIKLADRL
ncbi:HD domain-containing protein, partial [Escherichia coli]|uniref:HD domain-containing protein n=1 Tax=Escherichia coli TaxID=562 RepID=UPI0028DE18DA